MYFMTINMNGAHPAQNTVIPYSETFLTYGNTFI